MCFLEENYELRQKTYILKNFKLKMPKSLIGLLLPPVASEIVIPTAKH